MTTTGREPLGPVRELPLGDDRDSGAGVEHFGGHEMSQVVQSERPKAGGAAVAEEHLGDSVRFPRCPSVIVAEHERLAAHQFAGRLAVTGECGQRGRVNIDDMAAFGLGRGEDWAIRSFYPPVCRTRSGLDLDRCFASKVRATERGVLP